MDSVAKNITEKYVFENGRIFVAPTGAKDVVTFVGSVLGGSEMLPRDQIEVPIIGARLFDAGTKGRKKDELREALAARGADLSFSSGGERTHFSGSCLPEDLSFVLQLAAECLDTPIFAEKEITLTKERIAGRLSESKTETRVQASGELSRMMYDESSPNYSETIPFLEKSLAGVTRQKLNAYKNLLGKGGLVLAIAGDTDPATAIRAAEKAFAKLPEGTLERPITQLNKKLPNASEKIIHIPEKANIDVYLGMSIPLTLNDELSIPYHTLVDMLGGGFAAHLMQTVRERDGLTYGIRAFTEGMGITTDGSFRIWSTFSPDLYDKGIATIKKELKSFFTTGITKEKLAAKKDEMLGSYVIGLATTHGLAGRLHSIGARQQDLTEIDEWRNKIKAVTLSDLQDAAALIKLDKLSLAAAGTFAKK
jgi:zinc protease